MGCIDLVKAKKKEKGKIGSEVFSERVAAFLSMV